MIATHLVFFFFDFTGEVETPVKVRHTVGADNIILPVEIVTLVEPGELVLAVTLWDGAGNYLPIREDPFNPKRVKVRFVNV